MSWLSRTKAIIGKRSSVRRNSKDDGSQNQTEKTAKNGKDNLQSSFKPDQMHKACQAGGDSLSRSLPGGSFKTEQGGRGDQAVYRRSSSEKSLDTMVYPKYAYTRTSSQEARDMLINAIEKTRDKGKEKPGMNESQRQETRKTIDDLVNALEQSRQRISSIPMRYSCSSIENNMAVAERRSSIPRSSSIENKMLARQRSSSTLHASSIDTSMPRSGIPRSSSSDNKLPPVRSRSSGSMLHGATVWDYEQYKSPGLKIDNSQKSNSPRYSHSPSPVDRMGGSQRSSQSMVSSTRSSRTESDVDLTSRASSSHLISYASSTQLLAFETTSRVVVNDLTPGSLCQLAGLQKGDIITHVNFLPVKTAADVAKLVGDRDFHWLTVRRNQPNGLPPLVFNASTKPCPGSPPLPPNA
eukprot:g56953.t1